MLKSAASKVMWVGRATVFLVGLAVILALLFGVASTAVGKNGQALILGKGKNVATKVTGLVGKVATGSTLVVKNPKGGSALGLEVKARQAPLTVNAEAGTATNLDADRLDGKEASEFASAYERTVVVSPTGTDLENGTALVNALSGITDASASKPYLLFIEAGTYDLGNVSLAMKEHVDIQGAGELKTIITGGTSNCLGGGTVRGSNNAELRFITVRNTGTSSCGIAISNESASPLLTNVRAESTGAGNNIGVDNWSSNPTMTNVTATASGGSHNIGVLNSHNSNPTITNVTATASGGIDNYGVVNSGSSSPTIRHSRLSGNTYSLHHNGGTARVALTQLVGSIQKGTGTLQCFYNYNDSLAPVSCP